MAEQRTWINFARYSSPPIGKARQMEAIIEGDNLGGIWLRFLFDDGCVYEGWVNRVKEDEEE